MYFLFLFRCVIVYMVKVFYEVINLFLDNNKVGWSLVCCFKEYYGKYIRDFGLCFGFFEDLNVVF